MFWMLLKPSTTQYWMEKKLKLLLSWRNVLAKGIYRNPSDLIFNQTTCGRDKFNCGSVFSCQTMVRWKTEKVLRFTLFLILLILLCDWYIFPLLFSNIVHSRYFSLRCGNENEPSCNELDKLFLNRYTNCKEKAKRYWINQPRKLNTKSIVYDGLNRYWSKQMIEFLGAKYLVLWSSRSLKMRELSFSQFWGKWFIFQILEW